MGVSKIEWTDAVWNTISGCTMVSAGCANCYAERMSRRLVAMGQKKYAQTVGPKGWTGTIRCHEDQLSVPVRRRKPTVWFVNSMSDTFHDDVPGEFLVRMIEIMNACPQHRFLLLTKRPQNIRRKLFPWCRPEGYHFLPRNVGIGVSAENQAMAELRVKRLLGEVPSGLRFVSAEPMLGKITLADGCLIGDRPDWLICGGESGPGARAMAIEWVRALRDECRRLGIPFFFKQWGGVRKHETGRVLDGRTWDERPEGFFQ